MKQLLISTGGHRFRNDDLLLLQEAYTMGFAALMSSITSTTPIFVVSGCVATVASGTLSITSGFIAIDGELLYHPGTSMPYNGANYYVWEVMSVLGAPRQYFDLTTHPTQDDRTAQVVEYTTSGMGQDVLTTPQYKVLMQSESLAKLANIESDWIHTTITPTLLSTGTATFDVAKLSYKFVGKTIMMQVYVELTTTSTQSLQGFYFPLPAGAGAWDSHLSQTSTMLWESPTGAREVAIADSINATPALRIRRSPSDVALASGVTVIVRGTFIGEIE